MSFSDPARQLQAIVLALLLEAVLLGAAGVVLAGALQAKPAIAEPVTITLLSDESSSPPPPPPPSHPPPPPKPKPKPPEPRPKQQSLPQLPPPPTPLAPLPIPLPQVAAPTAFSEPVKPPLPPPPAAAVTSRPDQSLEYAAKVRAAVQAAVFYPTAAAALRFSGRVRLEFHLRDGVPGEAQVLVASGIGFIDGAALQAVRSARYPEPPAEMRGADRVYQVWVEFNR